MSDDDRQLLARVAERDLDAYRALYERYFRRLFGFVFKLTRRADVVEEAVQETLLVVWRDAHRFDGRGRVSSWIFGIAYRRALKRLASETSRVERERSAAREEIRREPQPGPEGRLHARERAAAVWQALAELSPEQRAVVELTFYEGLSYRAIAEIVGCPVNTVKSRMFHARQRLRDLLPALGVGDASSA
jgi:RNA polymerase sigma-70 factor (ECF subfamily)